jgi:hypothetical protein
MALSKNLILLALGIIFLAISPLVSATYSYCDKYRPPIEKCYNDDYKPVCGYYTKNCPFKVCGKTLSSECYACADPTITYYQAGECKPEVQVNACPPDACDPVKDPGNAYNKDYFDPVCGIKKKCYAYQDCDKTFKNVCGACTHGSYPYYQNGPCESEKKHCGKKRPYYCPYIKDFVCASFTDKNQVSHYVTVNNGCNACKDKSVDYYLKGYCPSRPLYNQTYCLPNSRPKVCTFEYNPVCGFYEGPDGNLEHKIMSNPCLACYQKKIIYYTPGPCVFYCDRSPLVIYDCGGDLNPVCGSYKENGKTKTVSLRNGCVGCYYHPLIIDSYTEGLCPGDNGILCKYNGVAFLDGFYEPVCGLTKKNCNNKHCRKTYGDSVSACSNPEIVKYIPGLCPGDYGVPCDDFRGPKPDDKWIYGKVCGYTKKKCHDESCRNDYDDEYQACANLDVLHFIAGSCDE